MSTSIADCTVHQALRNLLNEMLTDITNLKTMVNALRGASLNDVLLSGAALSMAALKKKIANGAFTYRINGVAYHKAADTTGCALTAETIPQSKYGAYQFEIGTNGTVDCVPAPDNATGYDSAALALAALPAVQSDHVVLGTLTVTDSNSVFVSATDDLDGSGVTKTITSVNAYVDDGDIALGTTA